MSTQPNTRTSDRRRIALAATCFACLGLAVSAGSGAFAQDLQSKLDEKKAELDSAESKKAVLSDDIEEYTAQIDQLTGEVATLREREAVVEERLDRTQSKLNAERKYLNVLRARLRRSMDVLKDRLVEIYKSDEPDALTVILQSDGFDDLLERYQYLDSVQEQDASIVDRVHDLRDTTRQLVETIREQRDEIADREAELERTRIQLEAREADLAAARSAKADAVDSVESTIERLEGDIGDIQDDIAAQIQAAQAAAPAAPLPAGPVPGESSSGFIFPVDGAITSPFGWRWGRMHEGIDIAAPAGTPIRAAADGNVILAAPTSGYGNYTCIDHGGGLSTCYAHQSSYAVTSGAVKQGTIIGYVGCTGSCFGDHLHFEVRVNGSAVDPMGYL